jgi:hypothetical protein
MSKGNKKADAFEAGMMAGVKAERSAPAVSVQERLRRANELTNPSAEPARVVETVERVVEKIVAVPDRVPLEDIKSRLKDIRPVNEGRARRFAVSIALVGLIQPPAIDKNGRLLAGDHRRRALTILREVGRAPEKLIDLLPTVAILADGADESGVQAHEAVRTKVLSAWSRFGFDAGVPVHRMDIDSEADPELAKSIEATENFQREDFTKEEVQAAYKQLVEAGYRESLRGRPRAGEKPIRTELALVFGKAERTISRYLADMREEQKEPPAPPEHEVALAKLKAIFPAADLTVSSTGKWKVTIQGSTVKTLEEFVASLQPEGSA